MFYLKISLIVTSLIFSSSLFARDLTDRITAIQFDGLHRTVSLAVDTGCKDAKLDIDFDIEIINADKDKGVKKTYLAKLKVSTLTEKANCRMSSTTNLENFNVGEILINKLQEVGFDPRKPDGRKKVVLPAIRTR